MQFVMTTPLWFITNPNFTLGSLFFIGHSYRLVSLTTQNKEISGGAKLLGWYTATGVSSNLVKALKC